MTYRSQIGQDYWVHSVLGDKEDGFFVELGACDGLLYSNTLFFERKLGWNGLCIEPNDEYFAKLQANRSCHISNELISSAEGMEVDFLLCNATSGIVDPDHVAPFFKGDARVRKTTTTLAAVLDAVKAPSTIDYLSLDVEGQEYPILSTFPFERYTFRCITVEHNEPHVGSGPRNAIRALLESKGYRFVKGNDDVLSWGHGPIDDFYVSASV
jgi:hypothetical protein